MISRLSGKPAIGRAANVMANNPKWKQQQIDIQDLNVILEGMCQKAHQVDLFNDFSQVTVDYPRQTL